jgi:hypothetical protein
MISQPVINQTIIAIILIVFCVGVVSILNFAYRALLRVFKS